MHVIEALLFLRHAVEEKRHCLDNKIIQDSRVMILANVADHVHVHGWFALAGIITESGSCLI